jgi:hypothetical protein
VEFVVVVGVMIVILFFVFVVLSEFVMSVVVFIDLVGDRERHEDVSRYVQH